MRRALGGPRTKSATSGLARGWPLEAPAKAWEGRGLAGVCLAAVVCACVPVVWPGIKPSCSSCSPPSPSHPELLGRRRPVVAAAWADHRPVLGCFKSQMVCLRAQPPRRASPGHSRRRAGRCVTVCTMLRTSWAELQSTRNSNSSSRVQPGGCDSENEHHRKLACKRAGIDHGGAIFNDAISPRSHEAQARFCCHLPGPATHALQHPRAGLANGGSPIVALRTAFGRPRRAARRQALGLPWPGSSRDSSTKKRTGQRQQSTLFTPSRPDLA